jgi:hypothetical protein
MLQCAFGYIPEIPFKHQIMLLYLLPTAVELFSDIFVLVEAPAARVRCYGGVINRLGW